MVHTTIRLKRVRNSDNSLRGWLAVLLLLLSAAAAYFVFTRDIDWDKRGREERGLGQTTHNNGNQELARDHFEAALANNPYDWRAHLALANLLNHYLGNQDGALRHYLYALAYSPEPGIENETQTKITILRLMRTGELEDPRNALEDMFVAVENDAVGIFSRRLSVSLYEDAQAYWKGWKERGRGRISYCRIENTNDGYYDATVELDFPDGTTMAMHFICSLREVWRLQVSFP